jgi:hypothetical protein
VLPAFVNELASAEDPLVLVLDDYHLVTSAQVHTTVATLLDRCPPQLHLMLITRANPPLPLSRLRVRGDLAELRADDQRGLVYRYLAQDGLSGEEGTFLLCTFWLAQAQAMAGEVDRAVATFERAVSAINDVGLLAEEIDANGEMIGNFPQAFSHIGLVNAAWAIAQAQQRRN